jgi:hypothetical protein
MATVWDKIRQFYEEKKTIKSKVMFNWKYYKELEDLMEKIEGLVEKEIVPNYPIEYISYWNSNIKVKVDDRENDIERLINCALEYTKNDERYWYINLKFLVTEFSQNKKVFDSGKFFIRDKDKILAKFLNDLKPKITEIHLWN